jgi:hypothetical protein
VTHLDLQIVFLAKKSFRKTNYFFVADFEAQKMIFFEIKEKLNLV